MSKARREYLRRLGAAGSIVLGDASAGCLGFSADTEEPTNVRIGSKPFPEQQLLGYLAYHCLRGVDDVQVVDEIGYGDSLENWRATKAGTKDLYWEYTGTAWRHLPPEHSERISDRDRLYDLVSEDARAQGLRIGSPASFSNSYVLAADRRWSERTGVGTISELAAYVADGNTGFGVAINNGFYHRADGWTGVTDYYGVDADSRRELESGTFVVTSTGLTYELLRQGRVRVASGFGTDPELERRAVVELADDREYFVPYQPVPTAYAPTVENHPELFDRLAPVAASLDVATIRRLNDRVLTGDATPSAVAQSYLQRIGETA